MNVPEPLHPQSELHPEVSKPPGRSRRARTAALLAGPVVAAWMVSFVDLAPGEPAVTRTAAVALWMAIWWIGEAIPLAATALLPLVLFPLLGVLPGKEVAARYVNSTIFLFIGGFLVALAMQRWRLHQRIALWILLRSGVRPAALLASFMVATWFLSMWISNTATTMMMVPIALAIVLELESSFTSGSRGSGADGHAIATRFSTGVFLGVAYAASIGGIATLVGTPPNLSLQRIFANLFPEAPEISFAAWFIFALPASVFLLVAVWGYLSVRFCPRRGTLAIDPGIFRTQHRELGPMRFAEKIVLADFIALVLLWLLRSDLTFGAVTIPGWSRLLPESGFVDDGTVAIAVSLLLFVLPSRATAGEGGEKDPPDRILDWEVARGIPWGLVLLFGGGFALAHAFDASGLSLWLGERLSGLSGAPTWVVIAATCTLLTFLTELTSNTATADMLLPVLASLALALDLDPRLLMVPGALACSCAFMLPVATPPNAIIFATERVTIGQMARTGFAINVLAILVITVWISIAGGLLGIGDALPSWARP